LRISKKEFLLNQKIHKLNKPSFINMNIKDLTDDEIIERIKPLISPPLSESRRGFLTQPHIEGAGYAREFVTNEAGKIDRELFNQFAQFGGKLFLTYVFLRYITGCASIRTEPNQPYKGPYPENYKKLAQIHPLIGTELGRLPEIQDGISPKDESALENLVKLYDSTKGNFNNAFQQMYQEGKPEVRKYCTPLRYLFKLAGQGDLNNINSLIEDYDIYDFMETAWRNIEPPKDLDIITSELNSPRLLDINYIMFFNYMENNGMWQDPKETFERKEGNCLDHAIFNSYCLDKGGYKTLLLWSKNFDIEGNRGHIVSTFNDKGELSYLDIGSHPGMFGPFESLREIGIDCVEVRGYLPSHIFITDLSTFLYDGRFPRTNNLLLSNSPIPIL